MRAWRLGLTVLAVTAFACGDGDDAAPKATAPPDAPTPRGEAVVPATIEDVVIHPFVAEEFTCGEHPAGSLTGLGDALGTDCTIIEYDSGPDARLASTHSGDGSENEDFHGWHATLLAPFDGTVEEVYVNDVTNEPGTPGEPPAGSITFRRDDGAHVVYAHVDDPRVDPGDQVTAGQPVGLVGNNGVSYLPHTHIGAWRGDEALQVRFDLHDMGELRDS